MNRQDAKNAKKSRRPEGDREGTSQKGNTEQTDLICHVLSSLRVLGALAVCLFLRARSYSINANTNSVQPPGKASVSGQIWGKRPATAEPQPTGTAMYCLLLTE